MVSHLVVGGGLMCTTEEFSKLSNCTEPYIDDLQKELGTTGSCNQTNAAVYCRYIPRFILYISITIIIIIIVLAMVIISITVQPFAVIIIIIVVNVNSNKLQQ